MSAGDAFVMPDEALDAMTDRERAGWLAFARALHQHVERAPAADVTYAAVPHDLLIRMGMPAYPLDAIAVRPDLCGLDGFLRDPAAGVDWICLLPYGHGPDIGATADPYGLALHGWARPTRSPDGVALADTPRNLIALAAAEGIRPELDDAGVELLDHAWQAAAELDGDDATITALRRLR